MEDPSPVGLFR